MCKMYLMKNAVLYVREGLMYRVSVNTASNFTQYTVYYYTDSESTSMYTKQWAKLPGWLVNCRWCWLDWENSIPIRFLTRGKRKKRDFLRKFENSLGIRNRICCRMRKRGAQSGGLLSCSFCSFAIVIKIGLNLITVLRGLYAAAILRVAIFLDFLDPFGTAAAIC